MSPVVRTRLRLWDPFVAAQRHPWAASLAAVFAVGQLPSIVGGPELQWQEAKAALAVLATTLAAHAVANGPSRVGRLSALVVGNLSAAFQYWRWGRRFEVREPDEMLAFVALSTVAWAWAVLAPRIRVPFTTAPAAALAAWYVLGSPGIGSPWHLVGLLALPLAIAGVVASTAPLRRWLSGAAAFGAVVGLAGCWAGSLRADELEDWLKRPGGHAIAGVVIALLGGACRRARRVTAVPADHASIVDFPRSAPRDRAALSPRDRAAL